MLQTDLLNKDIEIMKENITEMKDDFKGFKVEVRSSMSDISEEIKNVTKEIKTELKEEYVTKVEYKGKMSILRRVLGVVTTIVLGVIMFFVNLVLKKIGGL